VADTSDMLNRVAALAPGARAAVSVLRQNRPAQLEVRVGKRPPPQAD
jgi:S1-C subfamily serine protease